MNNTAIHTNTTAMAEALEVHATNTSDFKWIDPEGRCATRTGRGYSPVVTFDGELYGLANNDGNVMQWTTKKVATEIVSYGFPSDAVWLPLYTNFSCTTPAKA